MVDAILEATAQVLIEDGYDAASTNRIAKRAGVSVGSLYQYFPNKKSLVSELAHRHVRSQVELITTTLKLTGEVPLDELSRDLLRGVNAAHQVNPELHKVLVEQAPVGAMEELLMGIETVVRGYIERNLDTLRVEDPEMAAFILVTLVDSAMCRAVLHRPHLLQGDRLPDAMTDLIMRFTKE
jgi:AcrR family transcriptional regulator